jgi:hypothetical protein
MGFHVSLEVVAAPEQLTATFDMALEVGIFLSGELSNPCASRATTLVE